MLLLARQHLAFALAVERFYRITVEAYPPTRRRRLPKAFDSPRMYQRATLSSDSASSAAAPLGDMVGRSCCTRPPFLHFLRIVRKLYLSRYQSQIYSKIPSNLTLLITAALQLRLIVRCSNVIRIKASH